MTRSALLSAQTQATPQLPWGMCSGNAGGAQRGGGPGSGAQPRLQAAAGAGGVQQDRHRAVWREPGFRGARLLGDRGVAASRRAVAAAAARLLGARGVAASRRRRSSSGGGGGGNSSGGGGSSGSMLTWADGDDNVTATCVLASWVRGAYRHHVLRMPARHLRPPFSAHAETSVPSGPTATKCCACQHATSDPPSARMR